MYKRQTADRVMRQTGMHRKLLIISLSIREDNFPHVLQHGAEQKTVFAEACAARFNFGHVQDLVDQSQQMVAGYLNFGQEMCIRDRSKATSPLKM